MQTRVVLAAFAIASISFVDLPGLAHGGGLNSQGCHNETATGSYHCHRSPEPKEPKEKKPKKEKESKTSKKSNKTSNKKNKSNSKGSSKNRKNGNKKAADRSKKNTSKVSPKGAKTSKAIIQDCYDGDTCTTTNGEKIRLACINAPEIGSGSAAIDAKNKVTDLVVGKEVSIRRYEKDRYGRTVAEIFTPGGQSSSQTLVNGGFAEVYTQYADNCSWAR